MGKHLMTSCLAALIVLGVAPVASACSCAAGDPQDSLKAADAAFIGRLIAHSTPSPEDLEREGSMAPVDYRFLVEEGVKGDLGPEVVVTTAAYGASCGLEVDEGEVVGLFLQRRGDRWRSGLCSQIDPDSLRNAAKGMPNPESDGPVRLIVGGSYGDARAIALDEGGQTVAYGLGSGLVIDLDTCPGSRFVAELVRGVVEEQWWTMGVAVREADTMRVVRELPIRSFEEKDHTESLTPSKFSCLDAEGESFAAYATFDSEEHSKLVHIDGDNEMVLFDGSARRPVAFSTDGRSAYIAQGAQGDTLTKIDLASGERTQLGAIPVRTSQLVIDDEGNHLAGSAGSDLFVFDLVARERRSGKGGGTIVWIDEEHFVLSGTTGSITVRIYDTSAEVIDSWKGREEVTWTVHGDGVLYATSYTGAVHAAPARTGPAKEINRFDSPEIYAIEYVHGLPEPDATPPPATPTPTPEPTITPEATDPPTAPAASSGNGMGTAAIALGASLMALPVAAWLRRSRPSGR